MMTNNNINYEGYLKEEFLNVYATFNKFFHIKTNCVSSTLEK